MHRWVRLGQKNALLEQREGYDSICEVDEPEGFKELSPKVEHATLAGLLDKTSFLNELGEFSDYALRCCNQLRGVCVSICLNEQSAFAFFAMLQGIGIEIQNHVQGNEEQTSFDLSFSVKLQLGVDHIKSVWMDGSAIEEQLTPLERTLLLKRLLGVDRLNDLDLACHEALQNLNSALRMYEVHRRSAMLEQFSMLQWLRACKRRESFLIALELLEDIGCFDADVDEAGPWDMPRHNSYHSSYDIRAWRDCYEAQQSTLQLPADLRALGRAQQAVVLAAADRLALESLSQVPDEVFVKASEGGWLLRSMLFWPVVIEQTTHHQAQSLQTADQVTIEQLAQQALGELGQVKGLQVQVAPLLFQALEVMAWSSDNNWLPSVLELGIEHAHDFDDEVQRKTRQQLLTKVFSGMEGRGNDESKPRYDLLYVVGMQVDVPLRANVQNERGETRSSSFLAAAVQAALHFSVFEEDKRLMSSLLADVLMSMNNDLVTLEANIYNIEALAHKAYPEAMQALHGEDWEEWWLGNEANLPNEQHGRLCMQGFLQRQRQQQHNTVGQALYTHFRLNEPVRLDVSVAHRFNGRLVSNDTATSTLLNLHRYCRATGDATSSIASPPQPSSSQSSSLPDMAALKGFKWLDPKAQKRQKAQQAQRQWLPTDVLCSSRHLNDYLNALAIVVTLQHGVWQNKSNIKALAAIYRLECDPVVLPGSFDLPPVSSSEVLLGLSTVRTRDLTEGDRLEMRSMPYPSRLSGNLRQTNEYARLCARAERPKCVRLEMRQNQWVRSACLIAVGFVSTRSFNLALGVFAGTNSQPLQG